MGTGRKRLGAVGETLAASYYEQRGFVVLDRNWRCPAGELDLVVARPEVLVFAEVKLRSSLAFGHPAEAVTRTKQRRIRATASAWLTKHEEHRPELRFDVVAVLGGRLEVVEAAF